MRGQQDRFAQVFGSVGEAREKGEALLGIFEGNLGQVLGGVGQLVPGLGPFASLISPLLDRLTAYVDERIEIQAAVLEARTLARLRDHRPEIAVLVTESSPKLLDDVADETLLIERGAVSRA